MSSTETALNKVLTDYVIENANLKLELARLKQQLEEANKQKDGE